MKKFTKTILLTIGLLVGFTVNAHAVSAATLTQTDSGYWYDRAKADGSDHHSWHYTLYDIDGEVAYCIQPNTKEGVNKRKIAFNWLLWIYLSRTPNFAI